MASQHETGQRNTDNVAKSFLPFNHLPEGSTGTIDFSKLSGQVAHLACSGRRFVTDWILSPDVLLDVSFA